MFGRKKAVGDGRGSSGETFAARYVKGAPWDGYTDQEVLDLYRPLAAKFAPAEFEQAAHVALDRLTRQDRRLFGEYLQRQAEWQGTHLAGLQADSSEDRLSDAKLLAQTIAEIHQRQPGLLEALLGIDGNEVDSPLVKAVLAGVVASCARHAPVFA